LQSLTDVYSDVLHPNRANVAKDELRGKLGELYKAKKEDVSVFGFKTHYGGGKSTGFALIYDSPEAMKKFEPHYRLVRYGMASKIEKASRQQRTSLHTGSQFWIVLALDVWLTINRQAAQEQVKGVPGYGQDQGWCEEGQEISGLLTMAGALWLQWAFGDAWSTPIWESQRASCTSTNA
jgi:ribosomal protein S24E